jgi:parallel beta-helix repeat protein
MTRTDRRARHRLAASAVLAGLAGTAILLTLAPTAAEASPAEKPSVASAPVFTAEEAATESALVSAEDKRLTDLRTVSALARWQNKSWKTPYRIATGDGYTLVLTQSSTAYTLADLFTLAPQTMVRLSDDSVLLRENIVVNAGATLELSEPGGLTLHLASSPTGFVSIVSFGGRLSFAGRAGHPLLIDSWDEQAGTADATMTDGRAYLRTVGGQFSMEHVEVSNLGFWSGRTGGIALTGTNRPDTGAIQSTRPGARSANGPTVTDQLGGTTITAAGALPKGAKSGPQLKYTVPALSFVTSKLSHVSVRNNAYGLFVSGATGLDIADSEFSDNTIVGVQLHRFVSSGSIQRTVANHNGGDGIALERGTQGIQVSDATTEYNAGNGLTLSGRPLAKGPSAIGSPIAAYGNNTVSNSKSNHNGRDGIHVIGGTNITLAGNRVDSNDMGIVVSDAVTRPILTGNTITNSTRHGLALVTGVTDAKIVGNTVDGATNGIYLRDSAAEVQGNTVMRADRHGISVVGAAGGTSVQHNVLGGNGPSAVDTARSSGTVSTGGNNTSAWHDSTPWYVQLKVLLRPMSLLWLMILTLVGLSVIRARRTRTAAGVQVHPYAHQRERLGALAGFSADDFRRHRQPAEAH